MNPTEAALHLVGPIYEAAADPSVWPHALEQFARNIGGTATGFTIHRMPVRSSGNVCIAINADPAFQREFDEYYHSVNIHMANVPSVKTGTVASSDDYLSNQEVLASEYYNDFLRRYDLFHNLGAIIAQEPDIVAISSFRPLHWGAFTNDARELFKLLVPHFRRAVKLSGVLTQLHSVCNLLDVLTVGVFIVDADARILQTNERGRKILEIGDGLTAALDRLRTWMLAETSGMLAAIQRAAQTAAGTSLSAGAAMPVHRSSGKRAYTAFIRPFRSPQHYLGRESAGAVIFVLDPEEQLEANEALLTRIWGLTPSEARLACALLKGQDLRAYCDHEDISAHTARTHLKRVFAKLGVKRQSELIAVLSRTIGHVS